MHVQEPEGLSCADADDASQFEELSAEEKREGLVYQRGILNDNLTLLLNDGVMTPKRREMEIA